ncbi:saccharopine dehydrogenase NADP-binding domain-containing protein [Streptomyces sp. NBC_00536]|uniref:saccharopine dehydrogenase C-terminal domain-containing protein n=1 Tax=Streptomyces sp. NBC_00536 TaxID=2975769 RepID=UPI002E801317|nr:saccharopine dehydrogenase C-terminal domain-containing protein [Streptomyces sp. NBC_00536]WUC79146.1 saccharopine dehydrogenase NADP-binding domain-containing protein [Streptomyces sp. NBC_00536]
MSIDLMTAPAARTHTHAHTRTHAPVPPSLTLPRPRRAPVAAPTSGTVHWIGTGLSTGRSGLELLCAHAERVVVWDRTALRGEDRLAALGLDSYDEIEVRALTDGALEAEVGRGDIVVSMLPPAEHPWLLRLALESGAHFACPTPLVGASAQLDTLLGRAAAAGLVVLTEAGLEPGIDHMMARLLVARARLAVGDSAESVDFTSYCGGIPAVPNAFRHRFSWAPYDVLAALGSPTRHISEGGEFTAMRPWEVTRPHRLAGEDFEVYPNHDSVPFVARYGVPADWRMRTFIRGTLRRAGWREAWEPVFRVVRTGDKRQMLELARELAVRHPATEADRDRVLLSVTLDARTADGRRWYGSYRMDLTGEETESAMARAVSLPIAYGVTRLLTGSLLPGVNRAAETVEEAARWLTFLDFNGLRSTFTDVLPDAAPRSAQEAAAGPGPR